jgi:hypothetical protein
MILSSWSILSLLVLPALVAALPFNALNPKEFERRNIYLPIERRRISEAELHARDNATFAGSVGIGDLADL